MSSAADIDLDTPDPIEHEKVEESTTAGDQVTKGVNGTQEHDDHTDREYSQSKEILCAR